METHSRYKHEANLGAYLGHYLAGIQAPATIRPSSVPGRRDARLDRRFRVNETASVFSPTFTGWVKILDVSKNGLGMMIPTMLPCGTEIQVAIEHAFVLGEVRHCTRAGDGFHAGLLVKNVLRSTKPLSRYAITRLEKSRGLRFE